MVCYTPATPRLIPRRQRLADLTNSISISLAATFLVTLAVYMSTNILAEPTHAVYFGTVTMLAAWALLAPGKLGEGKKSDAMFRRATHGAIGLGVGFLAFGLQDYLMLSGDPLLFSDEARNEVWQIGRISVTNGTGYPTLAAFMLFFGGLFAARRWWWQADNFRRSRFRVSSTLLTLVVGAVVAGLLHFPGHLGATWALAISAVVQLSAGWTPQEERLLPQPAPGSPAPAEMAGVPASQERAPVASV